MQSFVMRLLLVRHNGKLFLTLNATNTKAVVLCTSIGYQHLKMCHATIPLHDTCYKISLLIVSVFISLMMKGRMTKQNERVLFRIRGALLRYFLLSIHLAQAATRIPK